MNDLLDEANEIDEIEDVPEDLGMDEEDGEDLYGSDIEKYVILNVFIKPDSGNALPFALL